MRCRMTLPAVALRTVMRHAIMLCNANINSTPNANSKASVSESVHMRTQAQTQTRREAAYCTWTCRGKVTPYDTIYLRIS